MAFALPGKHAACPPACANSASPRIRPRCRPFARPLGLRQRTAPPSPAHLDAYKAGDEDKPAEGPETAAAPAPAAAAAPVSLSDLPAYPKDFVWRRLLTFAGIVVG